MERWRRSVLAIICGTALFGAALALRSTVNPWWTNLGAAAIVIVMSWAALGSALPTQLAPSVRTVAGALVLGAAMVGATHLGYWGAVKLWPGLGRDVAILYGSIQLDSPGLLITVPITALVVVAEELLWRGVVVELCQARTTPVWTGVIAVGLYVAPQLIGGAWVLIGAALVAGAVFTVQRLVTGGILAPVISHIVWSVCVFGLLPVR